MKLPPTLARPLASCMIATLAVLGTTAALATTVHPPAVAAPTAEAPRIVASTGHVDAPAVTWDANAANFTLRSHIGGENYPLEQTTNWLGKAYDRAQHQRYIYTVGDDPRLSFLGEEGNHLVWGPANAIGSSALWIGFGADTSLPVERFRDKSFTLDIVDFQGPGRMDLFTYTDETYPLTRLLSSHDPGFRSAWITPGQHTHNETTFTRPGRYTVSYRASARDTTGALIASAPQTVIWQVGGTQPGSVAESALRPTPTALASAQKPTFALTSANGTTDEPLSTLAFATGNAQDSGTVTFTIDGFPLASVKVAKGVAQWDEMIGSLPSGFQASWTPAAGSPTPAWTSAPLTYHYGAADVSTSAAGSPASAQSTDVAPAFDQSDIVPTSRDVKYSAASTTTSDDETFSTVTITPADDRLSLHVVGGYYSSPTAKTSGCQFEFTTAPGSRSTLLDTSDCADAGYLRFTATPSSRVIAGAATFGGELAHDGSTTTQLAQATRPEPGPAPTSPSTTAPTTPVPTAPAPTTPTTPTPTPDPTTPGTPKLDSTPVRLDDGHVDIGVVPAATGIAVAIGDDTRQQATRSVLRDPGAVTLVVGQHAKVTRSDRVLGNAQFDFVGPKGTSLWALPQQQRNGLIWPGFSTERLPSAQFPQGASLRITPKTAPEGAKWWAFTESLTGLDEILASSEGPKDLVRQGPAHIHADWVFTKPGTYTMEVEARAGTAVSTPSTVTFVVEGQAQAAPLPATAPTPGMATSPAPSSEVQAAPHAVPAPTASTTAPSSSLNHPVDAAPAGATSAGGAAAAHGSTDAGTSKLANTGSSSSLAMMALIALTCSAGAIFVLRSKRQES